MLDLRYDLDSEALEPLQGFGQPIEASDTFRLLSIHLGWWNELVVETNYGCRWGPGLTADTPGAILRYHYEMNRPEPQRPREALPQEYLDDKRPYFSDPAPLAFDPVAVSAYDRGEGEEGVPFGAVWADPLARTIWLAVKGRYLTSQYFRGSCLATAAGLRTRPPISADDIHMPVGEGFLNNAPLYLRVQIYPYIVRVLMDEGKWPYFHPGRANVADKPLGWIVR